MLGNPAIRRKKNKLFCNKEISHTKGRIIQSKIKKNIYPKNKKKKHDPSNFLSHSPAHTHKKTLQTLFLHFQPYNLSYNYIFLISKEKKTKTRTPGQPPFSLQFTIVTIKKKKKPTSSSLSLLTINQIRDPRPFYQPPSKTNCDLTFSFKKTHQLAP